MFLYPSRSIGYQSLNIATYDGIIPFDKQKCIIPNEKGKVLGASGGLYCAQMSFILFTVLTALTLTLLYQHDTLSIRSMHTPVRVKLLGIYSDRQ